MLRYLLTCTIITCSVILISANSGFAIEVEGDIQGEWTIDDSPVVVVGETRVPVGDQLTIQPGVFVQFHSSQRLIVYGRIVAEGTSDDPITFTRSEEDRTWGGVRLLGSDGENIFRFCNFLHSEQTANYPAVDSRGGALYTEETTVIIEDCLFQFNRASGQGGAVCCYRSRGEFNRNQILENFGFTEIVWFQDCEISVRYCNFADNTGDYCAGLEFEGGSAPIENNIFVRNTSNRMTWGNALYLVHGANPVVRNNLIADNVGGGGMYIGYGAEPQIFEQNTIVNNSGQCGIYMVNGGRLNAVNCIIRGNQGFDVQFHDAWAATSYSDVGGVEGIEAGEGLIDEDPRFIDPENGDYRLNIDSPCRDAGDPNSPPDPDGSRADMGVFFGNAFEFSWIPTDSLDFGIVSRGIPESAIIGLCYVRGLDREEFVLLQPDPPDWWIEVGPTEEWIEEGDTIVIEVSLTIPEDAQPGEYQGSIFLRNDFDRPVISTLDISFYVVEGVASLYGVVQDLQTGSPVAEAHISLEGFERGALTTISDREGRYELHHIPVGEFQLVVEHDDYLLWHGERFQIGIGDSTQLDVDLRFATCTPDLESITESLTAGDIIAMEVNLANTGSGRLEFSIDVTPAGGGWDSLELRENTSLAEQTGDEMLQAVEFINGEYWIAGSNNGLGRGVIYRFDSNFALLDTFYQATLSQYGITDFAWDGETLWGCVDSTVYGYNLEGEFVAHFENLPRMCTGIAWDPERELLWVSTMGSLLYALDRDGNTIFLRRDFFDLETGLAWNPEDESGMHLYSIFRSVNDLPRLSRFNVTNGQSSIIGALPGGECKPGGAAITNRYDPGNWTLIMVAREGMNPDMGEGFVRAYNLGANLSWIDVSPEEGFINPDDVATLEVTLNSIPFPEQIDLPAEIRITHNGRGGELILPVMLTVLPNAVEPVDPSNTPTQYRLHAPSPNPFNSASIIGFDIPASGNVSLRIFDLQGRLIETLNESRLEAGAYKAVWNAGDAPAGVYLCRMQAGQFSATRKLLLVR